MARYHCEDPLMAALRAFQGDEALGECPGHY